MPRTNVLGTTAAAGSGAQRCAQAGEREHITDSTAHTATATAADWNSVAMTAQAVNVAQRGDALALLRSLPSGTTPTQSPLQAAAADARTRFVVVLEGAAGADTAHAHTLRYLLKYLLRSRGLRCTEVRQLDHRDGVRGRADDGSAIAKPEGA